MFPMPSHLTWLIAAIDRLSPSTPDAALDRLPVLRFTWLSAAIETLCRLDCLICTHRI